MGLQGNILGPILFFLYRYLACRRSQVIKSSKVYHLTLSTGNCYFCSWYPDKFIFDRFQILRSLDKFYEFDPRVLLSLESLEQLYVTDNKVIKLKINRPKMIKDDFIVLCVFNIFWTVSYIKCERNRLV